ncbi:MAG TPA: nitroreductase family deazaflavin-dependent oxidoreductase [Methylomirabilota bacterium]|nr:nitroreductase family deazaflavin-dependent oxidoreductase [Methylomirabilota bacterium]
MPVAEAPEFRRPSASERLFNRAFGVLVGLGLGLRHNYLLEVEGRRTGRVHSTPVNVLELDGKRLLVAPRGRTQWVRNAETAGAVTLKKGRRRRRFRVRVVSGADKPRILSAYLGRFRRTVQRYFPVPAGSGPTAFAEITDRYPVFELMAGE